MCERIYDFKLCACADEPRTNQHVKGSKKDKKKAMGNAPVEYTWRLLRYIETKQSGEMGRVIMPCTDIGEGLTEEFVKEKLNAGNCFDFEYSPQDRDTLSICVKDTFGKYLSFIYEDGIWLPGVGCDTFNDVLEDIGKGKLKKVENPE